MGQATSIVAKTGIFCTHWAQIWQIIFYGGSVNAG
jgi:hypothetical protein